MVSDRSFPSAKCAPCGLAKYLNILGGITVDEALEQAGKNIEAMREDATHLIDKSMLRLSVLHDYAACAPSENIRAELHAESTNILGLAGTFGLGAMGVAARLLCDYLDLLAEAKTWDPQGVILHYDAMRCLRTEDGSADCEQIFEGLQRLALRIASQKASNTLRLTPCGMPEVDQTGNPTLPVLGCT